MLILFWGWYTVWLWVMLPTFWRYFLLPSLWSKHVRVGELLCICRILSQKNYNGGREGNKGIGAPSGAASTVNQESLHPATLWAIRVQKNKLRYNTPGPGSTSLPLLLTSLPRLLASLPRRLILLRLLASLPRRLPARLSNSLPLRLARLERRLPGDTTIVGVGVGGCTCTLGSILLRGSGLPGRTEPRNEGCGLLLQHSVLEERERETIDMSVGTHKWHILRRNQQIITTTEPKISLMTFSVMEYKNL